MNAHEADKIAKPTGISGPTIYRYVPNELKERKTAHHAVS